MTIQILHGSDLSNFELCRRRFYFEKVERLKPYNQKVYMPFVIGIYGHLRLQEFYTGSTSATEKRVEMETEFSSNPEVLNDFTSTNKLCDLYEKHYAMDKQVYQVLSCEDSIPISIKGQTLKFTLDLKVLHIPTGGIEIIDHKFYKSQVIDEKYTYCLLQPWTYPALLSKVGQEVTKFHLNIIFKRNLKFPEMLASGKLSRAVKTLSNYTHDDYRTALELAGEEIGEKETELLEQLKVQDASNFLRMTEVRHKGREAYEMARLERSIDEINALDDKKESYPINLGYHCKGCPFFTLCHAEIEGCSENHINGILEFDFVKKADDER